jgi:hypothetical protein
MIIPLGDWIIRVFITCTSKLKEIYLRQWVMDQSQIAVLEKRLREVTGLDDLLVRSKGSLW